MSTVVRDMDYRIQEQKLGKYHNIRNCIIKSLFSYRKANFAHINMTHATRKGELPASAEQESRFEGHRCLLVTAGTAVLPFKAQIKVSANRRCQFSQP